MKLTPAAAPPAGLGNETDLAASRVFLTASGSRDVGLGHAFADGDADRDRRERLGAVRDDVAGGDHFRVGGLHDGDVERAAFGHLLLGSQAGAESRLDLVAALFLEGGDHLLDGGADSTGRDQGDLFVLGGGADGESNRGDG